MADSGLKAIQALQALHCNCGVTLLKPTVSNTQFVWGAHTCHRFYLKKGVVLDGWAGLLSVEWLLGWLEPRDRSLKCADKRETWLGGLTWAGTPASGQDAHAARGMQNLNSGISPRNLTTSVKDRAEKTCTAHQPNRDTPLQALMHNTQNEVTWLKMESVIGPADQLFLTHH